MTEKPVPATMSKVEYAEHRGAGKTAVSNWISRGKISGAALSGDRIVVAEADRQLGARIDVVRASSGPQRTGAKVHSAPVHPPRRELPCEPEDTPHNVLERTNKAKAERAEIDTRKAAQEEQERLGRYVLAADVRAARARELGAFLTAVDQGWPEAVALIVAAPGGQREKTAAARRWWREFRRKLATEAQERAEAIEELVADEAS